MGRLLNITFDVCMCVCVYLYIHYEEGEKYPLLPASCEAAGSVLVC